MLGLHGQREAFTILDAWSRMKAIYPVQSKDADSTAMCIRDFTCGGAVKLLCADGAIGAACRLEGILFEPSQPGKPQNNALIERANQENIQGTRTLLLLGICSTVLLHVGQHF